MEFETTLNSATDSILLHPKLDLFDNLARTINSSLTGYLLLLTQPQDLPTSHQEKTAQQEPSHQAFDPGIR